MTHRNVIQRIAIVVGSTVDLRDVKRLGIEHFANSGAEVDLINAQEIVHPALGLAKQTVPLPDTVNVCLASDSRSLKDCCSILGQADLIICYVGFSGDIGSLMVYREISKSGKPYLVISSNAYPGHTGGRAKELTFSDRAADLFRRIGAGRVSLVRSLLARLPKKFLGVRPADFIVFGGQRSVSGRNMYPTTAATTEIYAHAMDYDIFLDASKSTVPATRTAVFLDQEAFQPRDLEALKSAAPVTASIYLEQLRAAFGKIESEFDLDVVIAAGPRTNYENMPGLFGRRRIEYGRTAELVSSADLVIAHRSTAIGFAVMFNKPVMLITNQEMYDHWAQRGPLQSFSRNLDRPLFFLEQIDDWDMDNVMTINTEIYRTYMADFVKTPQSMDAPFWKIVDAEVQSYRDH